MLHVRLPVGVKKKMYQIHLYISKQEQELHWYICIKSISNFMESKILHFKTNHFIGSIPRIVTVRYQSFLEMISCDSVYRYIHLNEILIMQ